MSECKSIVISIKYNVGNATKPPFIIGREKIDFCSLSLECILTWEFRDFPEFSCQKYTPRSNKLTFEKILEQEYRIFEEKCEIIRLDF